MAQAAPQPTEDVSLLEQSYSNKNNDTKLPLQEIHNMKAPKFKVFRKLSSKPDPTNLENQENLDSSSILAKSDQSRSIRSSSKASFNSDKNELIKLEKLYRYEIIKSQELNSEREILENAIVNKEKIIANQVARLKIAENLLNSYKNNLDEQSKYFDNDYSIWLDEKQKYELQIQNLKLLLSNGDKNNIVDNSNILEEENQLLKNQLKSYQEQIESLKVKNDTDSDFKNSLIEQINKLSSDNKLLLENVNSLQSELKDATNEFTNLNENISFQDIFNDGINDVEKDSSSEIKIDSTKNNKPNTLDKELSSIGSKSTDYSHNSRVSKELLELENQYKSQSKTLNIMKFELNSSKQEIQQLFFFINQLLTDNEKLQNIIVGNEENNRLVKEKDIVERANTIREFLESSRKNNNKPKETPTDEVINDPDNKLLKFWTKNSVKDIQSLMIRNKNSFLKPQVLRSVSIPNPVIHDQSNESNNYNHDFIPNEDEIYNTITNTNNSLDIHPHAKASKTSNFRYFKKNNKSKRIISNDVTSSYSLDNDKKKKRNTIMGVSRSHHHYETINENKVSDESFLLNLKPLKIQKHSRSNSVDTQSKPEATDKKNIKQAKERVEAKPIVNDNEDFDVGNVSLNASIDLQTFHKNSNFNRYHHHKNSKHSLVTKSIKEEIEEGELKSLVSFEDGKIIDGSVVYSPENIVTSSPDQEPILEESSSLMEEVDGDLRSMVSFEDIKLIGESVIYSPERGIFNDVSPHQILEENSSIVESEVNEECTDTEVSIDPKHQELLNSEEFLESLKNHNISLSDWKLLSSRKFLSNHPIMKLLLFDNDNSNDDKLITYEIVSDID